MSITISGSSGIVGANGSAIAPALTGGDFDSGIFFPNPNTVAFSAGGTEVFRANTGGLFSSTTGLIVGASTSVIADYFNGTGSQTAFTLSGNPATKNNTSVYISGVYQAKSTYSLSTTTLTFSTAPPSGTSNIEVVWNLPLSIGTPSDGTITDAKINSSSKLYNRVNDIISVKDYGATGDGSTDDSVAIQNAINAAANKCLHFPAGIYFCGTASFSITSPIEIKGVGGPASCKLVRSSNSFGNSLFYATNVTGVNIRDIWCHYSNAATVVSADHAAIQTYTCNNVLIENVWVTGLWYVGIEISNCTKSVVNKCSVRGVHNRAIYCYQACKDTIFSNNHIDGAIYGGSTKTTSYGINVNPALIGTINNIVISDNTIRNTVSQGISTAEQTYGITIVGNSISDVGTSHGILVQKANGFSTTQVIVVGNNVSGCGQYGIYLTESYYVTCTGNVSQGNTLAGIAGNFIQNSVISGNILDGNGGDGIYLGNNSNRNIVTSNMCVVNVGYGLKIDGATSFYTRYNDNYFYTNTAGSVSDTGTGSSAGTNLTV